MKTGDFVLDVCNQVEDEATERSLEAAIEMIDDLIRNLKMLRNDIGKETGAL